jgi:hypothetical protein
MEEIAWRSAGAYWDEINLHEGLIELKNNRAKTGAEQAIPIVTAELKALIAELQAERRRIPNVDGLVLTLDGQPIDKLKFEYWFKKARGEAGIKNLLSMTSGIVQLRDGQRQEFPQRRR